jgi:hypothetical protein
MRHWSEEFPARVGRENLSETAGVLIWGLNRQSRRRRGEKPITRMLVHPGSGFDPWDGSAAKAKASAVHHRGKLDERAFGFR